MTIQKGIAEGRSRLRAPGQAAPPLLTQPILYRQPRADSLFRTNLRQRPAPEFLHCPRDVFGIITLALAYVQPSRRMLIVAGKPASVGFSEDACCTIARASWVCPPISSGWAPGFLLATDRIQMSPSKTRSSSKRLNAKMNLARPFTPTTNRRLNELIGFLIFVFAILLVLALVSYSPLDPSLNTAASPVAGSPAHNWIGIVGALVSDLVLQFFGVSAFLLPAFLGMFSLTGSARAPSARRGRRCSAARR